MNIKKRLKLLLRDIQVPQEELYYRTGYYFDEVKTTDDFNEIVRLFSLYYFGLDKWYIEKETK